MPSFLKAVRASSLIHAIGRLSRRARMMLGGTAGGAPPGAAAIEAHYLRTVLDTIPDLVWLKDADGVYLACNASFERFFGAPAQRIVGRTDYDFVAAELADFFRDKDRAAMAAGGPNVNEEWVTFASDGRRALVETIKTPMRDAGGQLIGVLGIARDITERKRVEDALHASERNYRDLSERAPIGIYQRSLGGEYTFFNAHLVAQFECRSSDEFLALYGTAASRWDEPRALAEFVATLERDGVVRDFQVRTRLVSGKIK